MDYQEAIEIFKIEIEKLNTRFIHVNHIEDAEKAEEAMRTAISAMQEMQEYKQKLNESYGECDGLLKTVVDGLARHEGIDIGKPIKSRILTDEHVDLWEGYKRLGTLEEVQEAVEKQKAISREVIEGKYFCPKCHNLMPYPGYCGCGQKLY